MRCVCSAVLALCARLSWESSRRRGPGMCSEPRACLVGPPVFFSPYLPSPAQGAPGSPPAAAGGMTAGVPPPVRKPLPSSRLPGFLMPRDRMPDALIRARPAVLPAAHRARINRKQEAVQAKRIVRASKWPKLLATGIAALRHAQLIVLVSTRSAGLRGRERSVPVCARSRARCPGCLGV